MKKYVALILAAVTFVTCFAACKKPDGINTADSRVHAVVTDDNGELLVDEAGNAIYYVTDENGYMVKDENGEYATKRISIKDALVVGRQINCKTYKLTIPDGWSDSMSYTDLIIQKDGTKDKIKIMLTEGDTVENVMETKTSVINIAKSKFPSAESGAKEIKITDEITAQYTYVYVEDTGTRIEEEDGSLTVVGSFAGFIFIQHKDDVYSCMLTSYDNMNEQLDDIVKILGTIEFI